MRFTKLAVVLCLRFAITLVAADLFVGTWKLNSAKTKYKTRNAPKAQTVTYSEDGADLHVLVKGTSSDGQPFSTRFSAPIAGGTGKVIESPCGGVSMMKIGANRRDSTFSKGGKEVFTAKAKVSGNGKTLTINVNGTNVAGQLVEGVQVYDKQ